MHTLHHIAVQANSEEEAFDIVSAALNESGQSWAGWSDWHAVGGGRWHSKGKEYQYEDDPSDVVSYAKDPEKFTQIVNDSILRRQTSLLEYYQHMKETPEDVLKTRREKFMRTEVWPNPLIEKYELDMPMWYLTKIVGILNHDYGPDSGLFDLVEYTAEVKGLRDRMLDEEVSSKQYLVPIDFHF